MTWVKLPDDALENPKVADVEPTDIVAYLRTLGWSNRWARDGRIPQSIAGSAAESWIAAGLATQLADGSVQLDWLLEHQPKADEIERRKKDAADRQERHRRHMSNDHSKCDAKRCLALLAKARANGVTRDKTRDKRTLRSDSDPSLPEGRGEERAEPDGIALIGEPPVSRTCSQCGRDFLGHGYESNPDKPLCSAKCRQASETVEDRYLRAVEGSLI